MRPSWDVVWLSDIPWASLWQRPQQLATRIPGDVRVLFIEPWTLGHAGAMSPARVAPNVERASFPFLPLHARSHALRRVAYRLGSSAAAAGALVALQRAWVGRFRGFFRPGVKRLAVVENFMAYPTLDAWRPDRVIYDMIDAPLHFAPVPPRLVPLWEALLRRADRVIVSSTPLEALARSGGAEGATVVGNGVDAARFAKAEPRPDTLPGSPGAPVVGYVGSIHAWFDVPLVAALARSLPEARVILVGPAHPATARELDHAAAEAPNLYWIGPRPYAEIPSLVASFSVGLIPFRRTPLTEAVNPVKLYEYAAAGVPCVSTRFSDEVERWSEATRVADSEGRFIAEVRDLLAAPTHRATLRAFAARHDWDEIALRFSKICLEEVS